MKNTAKQLAVEAMVMPDPPSPELMLQQPVVLNERQWRPKRNADLTDQMPPVRPSKQPRTRTEAPQRSSGALIKKVFRRRKNSIGNAADARRISQQFTQLAWTTPLRRESYEKPPAQFIHDVLPWEARRVDAGSSHARLSTLDDIARSAEQQVLESDQSLLNDVSGRRAVHRRHFSDPQHVRPGSHIVPEDSPFAGRHESLFLRRNHAKLGVHISAFRLRLMASGATARPLIILPYWKDGSCINNHLTDANKAYISSYITNFLRTGTVELFDGLPSAMGKFKALVRYVGPPLRFLPSRSGSSQSALPLLDRVLALRQYRRSMVDRILGMRRQWLQCMRGPDLRQPLTEDKFPALLGSWAEKLQTGGRNSGYPGMRLLDDEKGVLYRANTHEERGIFWSVEEGIATQVWLARACFLYQRVLLEVDKQELRKPERTGILSESEYDGLSVNVARIQSALEMGQRNGRINYGWEEVFRSLPFAGLDLFVDEELES